MKLRITKRLVGAALSLSILLAAPTQFFAHNNHQLERTAGFWSTYVLTSGAEVELPPPPHASSEQTRAELAELRALQDARTPETQSVIEFWGAQPATKPWIEKHLELIRVRGVSVPRAHRGLALTQVAIYDALVAEWRLKFRYSRDRKSVV